MKMFFDHGAWQSARFSRLCYLMGWTKPTAVGTLCLFWHSTRTARLVAGHISIVQDHLPVDTTERKKLFEAMLACDYIKQVYDEQYEIEGNADFDALTEKRKASGRLGRSIMVANWRSINRPEAGDPNRTAWEAYAAAYGRRYSQKPVRNAQTNIAIAKLVARLGQTDTPDVLAWYVECADDTEYRRSRHGLDAALKDAEAIYGRWHSDTASKWSHAHADDRRRARKGKQLDLVS